MSKPKIINENPASELFNEILENQSGGATGWYSCEFCGRTYFNRDIESEDYNKLKDRENENPDKYIEVDYSISCAYLAGKQYVVDCDCNAATNYENFIWFNRALIAEYLQRRAQAELEEAQDNLNVVKKIPIKVTSEYQIDETGE